MPPKRKATKKEQDEKKYLKRITAVENANYPPAAMPELDPLKGTQHMIPHRFGSHRNPRTPVLKNANPYSRAAATHLYYDPASYRGNCSNYLNDNTERQILTSMVTPPSTPTRKSPTTPEILSALKNINDSPKPSPIYSPPPDIYPELGDLGLDPNELPPPPSSPSPKKKKKRKTSKGGKKQCRHCKKYYTCKYKHNCYNKTKRKSNKRNTKKRGKY